MAKTLRNKIGIGALIVYALLTALTTVVLFELGSKPLGYASLASLLPSRSAEDEAAKQRYGKMWIRADHLGHCREYALDNKTQRIVLSGMVVCNPEQYARFNQRSRAELIRDAFRGQ
jgi:hypothetical protein